MSHPLTRSRLAMSAALTPSAAFVPARITAERGEKGQDVTKGMFTEQQEECDLNDANPLYWALRTVLASWLGPKIATGLSSRLRLALKTN